ACGGAATARARPEGVRPGWEGGDRLERETLAFHARVREGFLALARIDPERIRVLDAGRPVADVREEIVAAVAGLLRERARAGGAS
ncbi:MAG TPA: dTMP kinase, partial [bacterium]|nr:dTMP kinase [bacterium]